jgi:endonuclease/exonuclease/phosphatase family metal-dependent hydrolase
MNKFTTPPAYTLKAPFIAAGFIPLLIASAILSAGCEFKHGAGGSTGTDTLRILSWNVQALFDGEENGYEYEDYAGSAGWTAEKYTARITGLAEAIAGIEAGVPDLAVIIEAESSRVLEDLSGGLSKFNFKWTCFANNPGGALGIGLISRYPIVKTRIHSIYDKGEVSPRPVLEAWLKLRNQNLALFICHWKSKLGGEAATESLRRASARVIVRRIREIKAEDPGAPVIVLGDLNENHDEYYRQGGICALLPDDPSAAEAAGFGADFYAADKSAEELQTDFLVLSRNTPPLADYFPAGVTALFSPWLKDMQAGSYYYGNKWETIDHVLLSGALFDGTGWEYDFCGVVREAPFINRNGYPNIYRPKTGGGLSDHLPLMLTLKLAP